MTAKQEKLLAIGIRLNQIERTVVKAFVAAPQSTPEGRRLRAEYLAGKQALKEMAR